MRLGEEVVAVSTPIDGSGAAGAPGPCWARDPWDPAQVRWWDGAAWTGEVRIAAAPPLAYDPATLVRYVMQRRFLAGILAIVGFVGALVPLFGVLTGVTAPVGFGLGLASARRIPAEGDGPVRWRAWAVVAIVLGALGSLLWLFWIGLILTQLAQSQDPFRGL